MTKKKPITKPGSRKKRSPTGDPRRRTAAPQTPQEQKELVKYDLRQTVITHLRTRKYPEYAADRENLLTVLGVGGYNTLDEFVKDSVNNYQDLHYPSTPAEREFDSDFGEMLKPKIKRKSTYQDVSRPDIEKSSGGLGAGTSPDTNQPSNRRRK